MAHLMKYRTKRPRIDHPVIWKLDQRERIQLAAESPERNAAPERSRREAGAHVREGWRCGDRPRDAQPGEGHLVTIQRDAIATDQPIGKLALPLAEQFEIKVPDSLDGLDPVMADLFASNQLLKVCSIRILGRDLAGAGNPVSQLHQLRPQGRQQLIHRLQVTLTGRRRPGSEFASAKGAERGGMARDVDRLRSHPGKRDRARRRRSVRGRPGHGGRRPGRGPHRHLLHQSVEIPGPPMAGEPQHRQVRWPPTAWTGRLTAAGDTW